MESLVSPLIRTENTSMQHKPILDDPYAYVSTLSQLTRHEYYYIQNKIKDGWITERDIEIIRFIFVHRWITMSQIARLFFPETERELTVRNRIRKLIKHGLLRKIEWSSYSRSNENRPSLYELGSSGADILKFKFGASLGNRDPRCSKDTSILYRLKYILPNELYIHLKEQFNMIFFEFHPILKINEEQQIPTAKYILKNPKGKEVSFYLLCHREEEKWIKTIRYQSQFYKSYLNTIDKLSILVILLSTDEKAQLARKILEQEGIIDRVWFVTDEDITKKNFDLTQGFFVYGSEGRINIDLK